MKKQRIVLASVLKPVDDTRMFEKMAKSLSSNPDYEIFIIGYPSQKEPRHHSIQFISHPNFNRLSLRRLLTPLFILRKGYKVKPDVFIVNTHELLIVAVAFRILFGCRIIYDVQENYWRNILWTDTFPSLVRPLLACWVRGKEILLSGFFHLFILAEKGFEKEMKFFGNKFIVVENKSLLPKGFKRTKSGETINLLFSGTISESTGVFEAIRLATGLYQEDRSVRLLIIGYCARLSTLKKLEDAILDKSFISVIGGDHLVSHEEIISHIARSDFGFVYYPTSPHTENKIPTKLYEYLSAALPVLIQDYWPWVELCAPYPAAIPIDFNSPVDAASLINKMRQIRFYTAPPTGVFWASEETLLLTAVDNVLV